MKDQKQSQENHENSKPSSFKVSSEREKDTSTAHKPVEKTGSVAEDREGKLNSAGKRGREFEDLDHEKLHDLHDRMEKDETLKQKFQENPDNTLKENGISLPEGYKASYDHQYIKPSDDSNSGLYGYRVGNINLSK